MIYRSGILLLYLFLLQGYVAKCNAYVQPQSSPLPCNDPQRVCYAYLHYTMGSNQSVSDVESRFLVGDQNVIVESISPFNPQSPYSNSLFVKVLCSCSASRQYLSPVLYNVTTNTTMADIITNVYQGLAWSPGNGSETPEIGGKTISISLLCGCSSTGWIYLLSHLVTASDNINDMASRFNSDISAIQTANNMTNAQVLYTGVVYFIPVNSVSGTSVAVADAPAVSNSTASAPRIVPTEYHQNPSQNGGTATKIGIILGAVLGTFTIVGVSIGLYLCSRSIKQSAASQNGHVEGEPDRNYLKNPCFKIESRAFMSEKPLDELKSHSGKILECNKHDLTAVVVDIEKQIVFPYEEIVAATDDFDESHMVGRGAYGTVYFAVLRDQDVAIKKMKASKTKEFIAELKILCSVHHTNLVQLIGYSSSEEELFLVYEYAENKSLSDRLHDPMSKGYTPLTWVTRVQIALDAARGLEYIHEHTKAHYVHRDVKTSNILLDGNFRGKIADFGLSKLVEQAGDEQSRATRVVGTFGYLAPEYLRDGQATTKSDVYAFGVVLFELITGQRAISKSKVFESRTPERRSLLSVMLKALKTSNPSSNDDLRDVADPNLENIYPSDLLYKVAKLAEQCVDEDPGARPDMKQVVFSLSHLLSCSIEWDASLAGISQEYMGTIEGR